MLSFRPPEPGDFGRVVRDARGRVQRIVEAKNASAREQRIAEVNAGVYCFAPDALRRALWRSCGGMPSRGEYYLTDAVEILARGADRSRRSLAEDWREAWGVNTRRDLAAAEEIEHRRGVERALDAGVTVAGSGDRRASGPGVRLAPDVVLHPFVSLEGETAPRRRLRDLLVHAARRHRRLAADAAVGPHCERESAPIGARAAWGPSPACGPGSVLGEDVEGRQLRRDEEHRARQRRQGAAPLVPRGRGRRRRLQHRRRRHHLQLRRREEAPNEHRRRRLRRERRAAGGARHGRRGAYVGAGTTVTEDVPEGALALSRAPQTKSRAGSRGARQKMQNAALRPGEKT